AADWKSAKEIGPSRRMRAAISPARWLLSGTEGEVTEPSEELRIEADHEDHAGDDHHRRVERDRGLQRRSLRVRRGLTEPDLTPDPCVVEERHDRVHRRDHGEDHGEGGSG